VVLFWARVTVIYHCSLPWWLPLCAFAIIILRYFDPIMVVDLWENHSLWSEVTKLHYACNLKATNGGKIHEVKPERLVTLILSNSVTIFHILCSNHTSKKKKNRKKFAFNNNKGLWICCSPFHHLGILPCNASFVK